MRNPIDLCLFLDLPHFVGMQGHFSSNVVWIKHCLIPYVRAPFSGQNGESQVTK